MDTSIVMMSQGEWSDYQTQPFRVLKPFKLAPLLDLYRVQLVPNAEKGLVSKPTPDGFIAWLAKHGYVEDLELHELHLGDFYGGLYIEDQEELLNVEFTPARPACCT